MIKTDVLHQSLRKRVQLQKHNAGRKLKLKRPMKWEVTGVDRMEKATLIQRSRKPNDMACLESNLGQWRQLVEMTS
jgi:hypothetical protein